MLNKLKGLNRGTKVALVAVGILVLVPLIAFAYWTISPLWTNVEVNEALPEDAQTELAVLQQGSFVDADGFHKASGLTQLIRSDQEGLILRFEDGFKVTNGPDLYVWLAPGGDPDQGYVDLGLIKGNLGAQNYAVPEDVDFSKYDTVIIWCKAFGVLFGSAALEAL